MKGENYKEKKIFINVTLTLLIILVLIFITAITLYQRGLSFEDAFYQAFQLITHLPNYGYNSFWISILSLTGAFLGLYLIVTLISIIYGGALNVEIKEEKNMNKINKLKNHVIICGTNLVGSNIATRLDADNKDFVIIGDNKEIIKELKEKNNFVVDGNPLDEDMLKSCGIDKAALVLAVLESVGDNVLLTLTAKKINPKVKVIAKSNDYKYVEYLENIGADLVMMPEVLGAFKIADVAKDILEM
jgi:voltage-gated potassium channel